MNNAKVYRPLTVGVRGADVKAFQLAVNRIFKHYKVDCRIAVDGIYGPVSHLAARRAARMMGVTATAWSKMLRGRMPVGAQRLIRQDRRRTKAEKVAHGRRVGYRKAIRALYAKPPGPKIYTGIVDPDAVFGSLGPLTISAGHYTGGPVDESDAHAIALDRSYDGYHRSLGWGGLAYWINITREGNIILGRPSWMKGAHVANNNTGNLGIVMHGTTGTEPNQAQQDTLRWVIKYAHTGRMPASHRAPRALKTVPLLGHKEFPGNATSCPGEFLTLYKTKGARR